jgi:hypothetical protein
MRLLKSITVASFLLVATSMPVAAQSAPPPRQFAARFAGFRSSSPQVGGSRHRSRRNARSPLSLRSAKLTKALKFSSGRGPWSRDRKILDSRIPTKNGHYKASQLSKLPRSSRPVGWAYGVPTSRPEFIRTAFTAALEIKPGPCFLIARLESQRSPAIPGTKCSSS